jgi:hypothetical protein
VDLLRWLLLLFLIIGVGTIPTKVVAKESILYNFFFFFAVLGFELRAYTLSHSTSPFL